MPVSRVDHFSSAVYAKSGSISLCHLHTVSSLRPENPEDSGVLHKKIARFCNNQSEPNEVGEYALFAISEHGEPKDISLFKEKGISLTAVDHRPEEPPTPLLKAIMAHNRPTAVAIAQQLARDHAFDALTYKDPHGNDALHLAFESGDEELIRAFKPIYGQFQPETVSALMQERTKPALNIWA